MDYNVNFYVIFEYNKLNTNRVIRNDGFYFESLGEESKYKEKKYLSISAVLATPIVALIGVDINSFNSLWYAISILVIIVATIISLFSIYLFYSHNKKELNKQWNEIISDIKNIFSISEKFKKISKGIFKIIGFLSFIFLLLFFILMLPCHQKMKKNYIEKIKIQKDKIEYIQQKYDSLVKVCNTKEIDSMLSDSNNALIDSNQIEQVDLSETDSNLKTTPNGSDNNSLKETKINTEKETENNINKPNKKNTRNIKLEKEYKRDYQYVLFGKYNKETEEMDELYLLYKDGSSPFIVDKGKKVIANENYPTIILNLELEKENSLQSRFKIEFTINVDNNEEEVIDPKEPHLVNLWVKFDDIKLYRK